MSFLSFHHDGLNFQARDVGQGPCLLFQHGLTGDEAQVADVAAFPNIRRLTLECRAHGGSDAGPNIAFSIPQFADDVLAFAKSRGVDRFVVGGISMGAAIALRIAVVAPEKIIALILARPAWNWQSAPDNMQVFLELAGYIARNDREGFTATPTAQYFAEHAPDNLASFLKAFDRKDLPATVELMRRIAKSGPEISETQIKAITVPTLVLANKIDLVHPLSHAEILASAIPHAKLVELVPKANDKQLHTRQFRAALLEFLTEQGTPS